MEVEIHRQAGAPVKGRVIQVSDESLSLVDKEGKPVPEPTLLVFGEAGLAKVPLRAIEAVLPVGSQVSLAWSRAVGGLRDVFQVGLSQMPGRTGRLHACGRQRWSCSDDTTAGCALRYPEPERWAERSTARRRNEPRTGVASGSTRAATSGPGSRRS